jgi:hypothetical protein
MDAFFVAFPFHKKGEGADYVKVICLNREPGDDNCEICRELVELRDSDDKEDKKAFKEQQPKDSYFFGVIPRTALGEKETEKVIECGTMLLEEILKYLVNPEYEDLLDPVNGLDMTINKSGKGMKTEYTAVPVRNPSPIIPAKPKGSKAFVGTSAEDTKLMDLRKIGEQFADEPDKPLLIWNEGWKALKKDAEPSTTKKAAVKSAPTLVVYQAQGT